MFVLGNQVTAFPQGQAPALSRKLPDGVYAVLRESPQEKGVLPLKEGERLLVQRDLDAKKAGKNPSRFLVVRPKPDVELDLAEEPKVEKEGAEVVRIFVKLKPKAAAALERLSRAHLEKQVAIVLDGEAVTVHKVRVVLKSGEVQITSCTPGAATILYDRLEAQRITPDRERRR
jgi:preprotein translocase subunit SecD